MYKPTTLFRAFVLTLVFLFSFSAAHAQENDTIEALQAQIADLLAIVADLQEQLASQLGTTPTSGSTYNFTSNLVQGDRSEAVRQLQIVLNSDPRTRIGSSGAGSPGQETTYFGAKTKAAVIKFQNLHRSDILTPVGLTTGSGYVGPSTRTKLNSLSTTPSQTSTTPVVEDTTLEVVEEEEEISSDEPVEVGPPLNISQETPLNPALLLTYEQSETFAVGSLSSYVSVPGRSITISGTGFTTNTSLDFEGVSVSGTPNSAGTELRFTVPFIARGVYEVTVSNGADVSDRVIHFVVANDNAQAPEIYSISPSIGGYGTTVTIYGKNFTSTGNHVDLGLGEMIEVNSSDGEKMTVTMSPGYNLDNDVPGNRNEWPLYVHVLNANGITEDNGLFVIRN